MLVLKYYHIYKYQQQFGPVFLVLYEADCSWNYFFFFAI